MNATGQYTELGRLAAGGAVVIAAGLLTGYWGWWLAGALAVLLAWHARQLLRVLAWLHAGARREQAPRLGGVWRDVMAGVERRRERDRQRRKRLAAMLDRFQRSTEAMPDGTVVLDSHYGIEWANSAARSLLGIDSPRDQGTSILALLRDPHFRAYLRDGEPGSSIDIASPVADGVGLNVRVIPYGEGQYLLMARDVSDLRRLETVRRDFVANVSHELRTPLTVITGYAETCTEEDLPAHVRDGLDAIGRQAGRMQALVDDLLTLSRLELDPVDPAAAEWVSVADMLADLVRDGERLSGDRGHRLALEADTGLGLKGAAAELSSAFANLINNAVQHTPAGSRVTVMWRSENGGALMRVEDDGPGIEPEHLPRITERFYRVDPGRSRARGGTGLGLALVKHAVARNGGSLEIASVPGSGSTFDCRFTAERVVDFNRELEGDRHATQ